MPTPKVTDEQIRETAYHMWIDDGAPEGKDQDYWYKAEAALTGTIKKKAPARKPAAKAAATAKKPAAKKAPAKKAAPAKGKTKS